MDFENALSAFHKGDKVIDHIIELWGNDNPPPPLPGEVPAGFVEMSALLTGVSADILQPLQPNPVPQQIYNLAKVDPAQAQVLQALILLFENSKNNPNVGNLAYALFSQRPGFINQIVLAWYLGSWYTPTENLYTTTEHPTVSGPVTSHVISEDAYTHALVWRAAQAHPMGHSTMTFGYWHDTPPSLSAYTGTQNIQGQ